MKKKKILFVTEANFHPTGYGVYTNEVLSRLHKHPQLEVAELACFIGPEAEEIKSVPWKFYANVPPMEDQRSNEIYNSNMPNKFGEFSFNNVLLDFQPDFVMDIRDWWMCEFEERSPFREFFNWAIMPTVDAEPQNPQWIDTYAGADAVFAYSEFGRDTMLNQCNKINFVDIASPCASDKFHKLDRAILRDEFNIDQNAIIFGTVMRNQRRKLYPDLFKAFKRAVDESDNKNIYLYIHTAYPDVGWDIPQLIAENGISGRVLITYKCKKCGDITVSFFNEAVKFCKKCSTMASSIVGINNKMEDTDLNKVYNLFDVYIQWANSEGWGMPQLEAAYAGLPVVSVDYSAMSSLVHNIDGIWIEPVGFYKELETGCNRAVPNNILLADTIKLLSNDPDFRKQVANRCHDNARRIYNWDYTAQKWADYFVKTPVSDHPQTWLSPPRFFNPQTSIPDEVKNSPIINQVNWLFTSVLGMPELIYKSMWRRVVKDLTYRATMSMYIPGYYYNDYAHPDLERRYEEFDLEKALNIFLNMRHVMNQWEQARVERLNIQ